MKELRIRLQSLKLSVEIFEFRHQFYYSNEDNSHIDNYNYENDFIDCDLNVNFNPHNSNFNFNDYDKECETEKDEMMMNIGFMCEVSEESLDPMAKIPSKCERCGLECPSMKALAKHKQEEHSKRPPGPATPALKAKDVKTPKVKTADVKEGDVKEAKARQPQTPGSSLTMARWIRGETRSNMVGAAIAESRETTHQGPKQDTPRETGPETPEVRTVDLDASISLLSTVRPTESPAQKTLTVTMFPPLPLPGDSNWPAGRQVEPEPEKSEKRSRARYDGEPEGDSEKKVDSRRTPEAVRMAVRTPRNLDNELARMADEGMEMELGPSTLTNLFVDVDPREWENAVASTGGQEQGATAGLHQVPVVPAVPQPLQQITAPPGQLLHLGQQGPPQIPILPSLQPRQPQPQPQPQLQPQAQGQGQGERKGRDLMSVSELEWVYSGDFDDIPEPQDHDQEQDLRDERLNQLAEDRDAGYEVIRAKNEAIEKLTSKLEDAMSLKEEYWDKIGELEGQVENLVKENSNMRQSLEAISDWDANQEGQLAEARVRVNTARDEAEKLTNHANSLQAEVVRLTALVEAKNMKMEVVKDQAIKMVDQAKAHVDTVNAKAEMERQRDNAEIQRRKAELRKLEAEARQLQEAQLEASRLQAEITRLTAEKDLEKHKRERSDETAKKMEDMLAESQRDRADKDTRMRDLENRIRDMSHKLPCSRPACDHSCGREHHCNSGRSRQRGPRNRSRGSSVPTVNNLATEAGVQVEDMQELVDEVQVQQQPRQVRVPHPRQQQQAKPWKVIPCPDYHYKKVCVRGLLCKNAHELMGADEVARGRQRPSSLPPASGLQRPQSQGRGAGKKKYTDPVYNPEHPHYNQWVQGVRASSQASLSQASGNGSGQMNGVAPVRTQQPQQQMQPQQGQAQQVQPQLQQDQAQALPQSQPQPQPQSQVQDMRPRSYSEATAVSTSASSGSVMARQTIQAAMTQQASTRAHLEEMEDPRWRAALEAARGSIRLPPSLTSTKSSSTGDLSFRRSGM